MGMVPELADRMLALARLGAPFTVVFGGFSPDSLSGRMNDMECSHLITQDGSLRRGKVVALKEIADDGVDAAPSVTTWVVVKRGGNDVEMREGRDHWWHDVVDGQSDDPASARASRWTPRTCCS